MRRRQPRRTRPDHCHGVPRQLIGDLRYHPALIKRVVSNGLLHVLDGDRGLVDGEDAPGLARRRAQPPRELWEVVGGVQPLACRVPVPLPSQVVPLGYQVPQWARHVTERHTAVHAAPGLLLDDGQLLVFVDLFVVTQTDRDGPRGTQLTFTGIEKALWVSHLRPPVFAATPSHLLCRCRLPSPAPRSLGPRRIVSAQSA